MRTTQTTRRYRCARNLRGFQLLEHRILLAADAAIVDTAVMTVDVGTLAAGTVSGQLIAGEQHRYTLQVAASQTYRFEVNRTAGEADGPPLTDQFITAQLSRADGTSVATLTVAAEKETLEIVLGAGQYQVLLTSGESNTAAAYDLAIYAVQYLGPVVLDPSDSPIGPGAGEEFCLPDTLAASTAYVWVDENWEAVPEESLADDNWEHEFWWDWYIDLMAPLVSQN